ncbi:hypothetical protein [Kitasatospora sp. NPDC004272]
MDDADEQVESKPIGDLIDALGVTATVGPGELVPGALVLLKVVGEDGSLRLVLAYSDGLGWIERAGLLTVAQAIEAGTSHLGDAG